MVLSQNNLVAFCAFPFRTFVSFVTQELFFSFHTYPQSIRQAETKIQRAKLGSVQALSSWRGWIQLYVEKSVREGKEWHSEKEDILEGQKGNQFTQRSGKQSKGIQKMSSLCGSPIANSSPWTMGLSFNNCGHL